VDGDGWQGLLVHRFGRRAWQRARDGESARVGLAAGLPLRQATAVIESVTAHEDLVTLRLRGHPWVNGEYWPMITPCFQVREVDDTGAEHEGVPGQQGTAPRKAAGSSGSGRRSPRRTRPIKVIVSMLWEAAWAEIDIPGRAECGINGQCARCGRAGTAGRACLTVLSGLVQHDRGARRSSRSHLRGSVACGLGGTPPGAWGVRVSDPSPP
jgi:hypothetical protein